MALTVVYFLSGMAVSGGRVAASLYALHMGTAEVLVGLLFGLYGTLPMFLSLAVGRWTDRIGPLRPIQLGVLAIAAGTALAVCIPHLSMLFVMAALCGIGFNLVTVAGQYAIGKLAGSESSERVKLFGWFSLGQASANVAGPVVAGVLIDFIGYKSALGVMVLCAGIAFICIAYQSKAVGRLAQPASTSRATAGRAWDIIATPQLQRIYVVGVLLSISWDIFLFLIPILGYRLQLSASVIGFILAAFSAGTFSIRLVMPWLARRYSEWQILTSSIVVIVVVFCMLPVTSAASLLALAGYVFGMAVGCSQPNMLSLLHANAPEGRGAEAVGLRQMLCNASGVVVPLTFGAVSTSLGIVPMFYGVACMMALAFPFAYKESRA